MANWGKKLFGLAAVGGAVAGLVYYFKNKEDYGDEDFEGEFEDNDFDLDNDLKPVTDREYVDLNKAAATAQDAVSNVVNEAKDAAKTAQAFAEVMGEAAASAADEAKEAVKDAVDAAEADADVAADEADAEDDADVADDSDGKDTQA